MTEWIEFPVMVNLWELSRVSQWRQNKPCVCHYTVSFPEWEIELLREDYHAGLAR